MKTKKQQRRSTVGFVLWTAVAVAAITAVVALTDPDGDGRGRLLGIGSLGGALVCAYLAGRWREL